MRPAQCHPALGCSGSVGLGTELRAEPAVVAIHEASGRPSGCCWRVMLCPLEALAAGLRHRLCNARAVQLTRPAGGGRSGRETATGLPRLLAPCWCLVAMALEIRRPASAAAWQPLPPLQAKTGRRCCSCLWAAWWPDPGPDAAGPHCPGVGRGPLAAVAAVAPWPWGRSAVCGPSGPNGPCCGRHRSHALLLAVSCCKPGSSRGAAFEALALIIHNRRVLGRLPAGGLAKTPR